MDKDNTKNTKTITIAEQKGRLSSEDLDRMYAEAEKFRQDDELMSMKIESKIQFEKYCYTIKESITQEGLKDHLKKDEKFLIEEWSKDGLQWIEDNFATVDHAAIDGQKKMIEMKYGNVMQRIYSKK